MKDEIVSGKPLPPKVTAVEPLEDWKLQLTFEDEKVKIFDMKPYRYGVFARLEDPDYFKRVRIVDGSLCWPPRPRPALRYALQKQQGDGRPITLTYMGIVIRGAL